MEDHEEGEIQKQVTRLWHELLRKLHRSPLLVELCAYNLGPTKGCDFASCSM